LAPLSGSSESVLLDLLLGVSGVGVVMSSSLGALLRAKLEESAFAPRVPFVRDASAVVPVWYDGSTYYRLEAQECGMEYWTEDQWSNYEADQREDSISNDMNACDEAFDDGAYERMQHRREQRYLENDANWVK